MWLTVARYLLTHPGVFAGVATRFTHFAWRQRRDLIAARGRIHKLSFFVHDFMDAARLDSKRCDACSFMVMTPVGPLSMCVHNAKRDAYLLVPARVERASKMMYFNPATGRLEDQMPARISVALTRKNARGRAKETEHP